MPVTSEWSQWMERGGVDLRPVVDAVQPLVDAVQPVLEEVTRAGTLASLPQGLAPLATNPQVQAVAASTVSCSISTL